MQKYLKRCDLHIVDGSLSTMMAHRGNFEGIFSLKEQHFDGWISNLSPKEPLNSCDIRYLQFARWPYSMDYYRMEDSTLLWYYNSIINHRRRQNVMELYTVDEKPSNGRISRILLPNVDTYPQRPLLPVNPKQSAWHSTEVYYT